MARKQALPNSWSKERDDKRSLCQMILTKVALPVGVEGKSYWEDTRNHKQQVMLTEGKLHARVV